jgi:hypothetical protein
MQLKNSQKSYCFSSILQPPNRLYKNRPTTGRALEVFFSALKFRANKRKEIFRNSNQSAKRNWKKAIKGFIFSQTNISKKTHKNREIM